MPASLTFSLAALQGFLLVLARVSGAFVFLPIPGVNAGPQAARIVLALALTVALYPSWPVVEAHGIGSLGGYALAEAAFGVTVGLAVGFIAEALLFGAQVIATQAGFGYASMVDPTTQAESSVMVVLAQLIAGLLFFSTGLDREVVRIFAGSLTTYPPGSYHLSPAVAQAVMRLSGGILQFGLRLALPVMAMLAVVDLSLALLGRLNAQLQLLTMAFPAKIMTALVLLVWMAGVFPRIYVGYAGHVWAVLHQVMAYGR
jgi:flagellar biosynthetic protein FliR